MHAHQLVSLQVVTEEGDLAVWDKPKEPDLVTFDIVARLPDAAEPFYSEEGAEFKVESGYLCPALAIAARTMKQGERATLKARSHGC